MENFSSSNSNLGSIYTYIFLCSQLLATIEKSDTKTTRYHKHQTVRARNGTAYIGKNHL